jgi:hypothetical protein
MHGAAMLLSHDRQNMRSSEAEPVSNFTLRTARAGEAALAPPA